MFLLVFERHSSLISDYQCLFVCFLCFPCLFHFPSVNMSLVPAASHSEHAHGPWRDEPKWTSSSASPWSQHALWGHGQQWASSTTHTQSDEWANARWVDASLPSLTPKIPTSCFPSLFFLLLPPQSLPHLCCLATPQNCEGGRCYWTMTSSLCQLCCSRTCTHWQFFFLSCFLLLNSVTVAQTMHTVSFFPNECMLVMKKKISLKRHLSTTRHRSNL